MSDFELLFPNAFFFSKNICKVDLDIDQHFFEFLKACFSGGAFRYL